MVSPTQPQSRKEKEPKYLPGREASLCITGIAHIPDFVIKTYFSQYGDVHVNKKTDDWDNPLNYTFLHFKCAQAAEKAFQSGQLVTGDSESRKHVIADEEVLVRHRRHGNEQVNPHFEKQCSVGSFYNYLIVS